MNLKKDEYCITATDQSKSLSYSHIHSFIHTFTLQWRIVKNKEVCNKYPETETWVSIIISVLFNFLFLLLTLFSSWCVTSLFVCNIYGQVASCQNTSLTYLLCSSYINISYSCLPINLMGSWSVYFIYRPCQQKNCSMRDKSQLSL